jgi:phosphoglycerol transferase MdoB-like AlkP superfamily enzyme
VLRWLSRFALFCLLLFGCFRALFLWVNRPPQAPFSLREEAFSFWYGLRMDISTLAYLLVLPVLLWLLLHLRDSPLLQRIHRVYVRLLLVVLVLIGLGNVAVYHFWGTLLNFRAISYLSDPKEAFVSLSGGQAVLLMLVIAGVLTAGWFGQNALRLPELPRNSSARGLIWQLPILLAAIVLGIRGGWQQLPMNESLVAFSRHLFLNNAAVNPAWHLSYEIRTAGIGSSNPFVVMPEAEAEAAVRGLFAERDDSVTRVLGLQRPNIVLIQLESFTVDLVGAMGGEPGISPNLDALIAQGLLFDSIYSSGFRTDQGITSLLNGWPATPYHSVMRSEEKSSRLPSLVKSLTAQGYRTECYYGGASNFSNLNVYLAGQGFDRMLDQDSFPPSVERGRWGVPDGPLFERCASEVGAGASPFFAFIITLSNHEPFDVPGPKRFPGDNDADRFRNAAAYTDSVLGDFFRAARKQPWYDSTLFVLVADHAHELPKGRDIVFPVGRRIPLVLFGTPLLERYRGQRVHAIGGHHDLPKTLLAQLGLDSRAFDWSKDLLSPGVQDFAYLPAEDFVAWVTRDDWFIWSRKKNAVVEAACDDLRRDRTKELRAAKAFSQVHYERFLAK